MLTEKEKIRILLVDDNRKNLFSIKSLLENCVLEVVTAETGQSALEFLMEESDFALVLLDVQLPDMSGFEIAELMKMKDNTRGIPIIFITAINREEKYVFKGYEAGAVDYIFKPVEPEILKNKVNVFLRLYRQRRTLQTLVEEKEKFIEDLNTLNQKLLANQSELLEKKKLEGILELARTVSHQFSQPLSVIMGYTELLSACDVMENREKQRIDKIMNNCEKLTAILRKVQSITDYELVDYIGESKMVDID